ncbi:MAG TPA: hypothetical protein VNL14_17955 [Candidatus Acidoferrales bacterium]|nr:hypothetical protein [Candidatus Acidoferrales bacterium]
MVGFIVGNRLWILGLLSAAIYAANLRVGEALARVGILDSAPDAIVSYLVQIAPLAILYLVAIWVAERAQDARRALLPILLFALLFRLPLIPLEPALSSDIYRYLWEGKAQVVAGANPYVMPPGDDRLAPFRDETIYPRINRKEAPTIYPAGAQILFALFYKLGVETPQAFKAVALAADQITLFLLILILNQLRLPVSRLLVYAWNPLVIYELFWSGHVESFMLPPLVAFIYFLLRARPLAAGVALGLAAAVKLVPIFLVAAVPPGKRTKTLVPLFSVAGIAYLFYADAGTQILGFLPLYFSDPYEIFNLGIIQLGLFWLAELFSLPASSVRWTLFALLLAILLALSRASFGSPVDIARKSYAALSAYLLVIYPAFHPWYFCALAPLLCFILSRAWILFSLLLPLSYLKYLAAEGVMPGWITLIEFIPLYLLVIREQASLRTALRGQNDLARGVEVEKTLPGAQA